MNQSRSRLVDLAGLLSNVTALHTLFSIFAFRQTGRSDPAGLLIWCVCLSLTCGGLALFLRRPRTQRSILLLALAALALQGARAVSRGRTPAAVHRAAASRTREAVSKETISCSAGVGRISSS